MVGQPAEQFDMGVGRGRVPSWIKPNISPQCPRPLVSRRTFSIDPSVEMTVSVPWPRRARSAKRVASV
ncbi:MAG: hypothetical protein WA268_17555 [Xanthobacteraceae bacterium]